MFYAHGTTKISKLHEGQRCALFSKLVFWPIKVIFFLNNSVITNNTVFSFILFIRTLSVDADSVCIVEVPCCIRII